jgi:two-component sensor histidine kinase
VVTNAERDHKNYVNEFRIVLPDGKIRWIRAHGEFLYQGDKPIRTFGLVGDITEARQQIETQRVLVGELQHRTRNLMAVVQSIAYQTLDGVDSFPDFERRFNDRLEALSRVQSLLSRADDEPIMLGTLVAMEFAALGIEATGDRITFGGPEAPLRKSAVEMLALAVHELMTNAIKYGALASGGTGRLSVTWRIEGKPPDQRLVLEWIECGIPSSAWLADSKRSGYGRTLIEEALPYSLSAETIFELSGEGLRCIISIPQAQV